MAGAINVRVSGTALLLIDVIDDLAFKGIGSLSRTGGAMRELKVFAPADCIVSNTPAENDQPCAAHP